MFSLPFLGFQSEGLARRVKSCVSKLYGFVNLSVIFNNTCRIKSFFPYKDRFSRSQSSKVVYRANRQLQKRERTETSFLY